MEASIRIEQILTPVSELADHTFAGGGEGSLTFDPVIVFKFKFKFKMHYLSPWAN